MGDMVLTRFCDSLLLFNHCHSSRVHNPRRQPHYEINPINLAGTNLSQSISGTSSKGSEKYAEEQPSREREHLAERPPHKGVQRPIPSSNLPCSLVSTRPSRRAYVRYIYKEKQQHQPSLLLLSSNMQIVACRAPALCYLPKTSSLLHCLLMYRGNYIAFVALARVHCMLFRGRGSRPIAALAPGRGFRSSIPRVSSHGWTLR
jgi:hypothetical protein